MITKLLFPFQTHKRFLKTPQTQQATTASASARAAVFLSALPFPSVLCRPRREGMGHWLG